MGSELLSCLVALATASTISILATLAIRRIVRFAFGAGASYGTWLVVPAAMVALLLPSRRQPDSTIAAALPIHPIQALQGSISSSVLTAPSADWATWALSAWFLGAAFFVIYLIGLQRAFVNSLGTLSGSRCVLRAERPGGCPALVGVLRPRVILPPDFESRYTWRERLLVLAHERTHLRRGDAVWNAAVALMRCVLWFNPFVHLASRAFREDQELACDAAVLNEHPGSRRSYATAMLKTQLADIPLPAGCHWHSVHHLKERLRMLKRTTPSRGRRTCGHLLIALTSFAVAYAAWAAEPPVPSSSSTTEAPSISLQFRLLVDDAILNPGENPGHKLQVSSRRPFDVYDDVDGATYDSRCVVNPLKNGVLLIRCKLRRNGQVFATPSVATRDGQRCAMEVAQHDAQGRMRGARLEITPSVIKRAAAGS
jgi:bla regulator protein blaR1